MRNITYIWTSSNRCSKCRGPQLALRISQMVSLNKDSKSYWKEGVQRRHHWLGNKTLEFRHSYYKLWGTKHLQKDTQKNQLGLCHYRWGSLNEKWSKLIQLKHKRDSYINEALINRYSNLKQSKRALGIIELYSSRSFWWFYFIRGPKQNRHEWWKSCQKTRGKEHTAYQVTAYNTMTLYFEMNQKCIEKPIALEKRNPCLCRTD